MKFWQGLIFGLTCTVLALLPAVPVDAASVSGRSSTALEWFDDPDGDNALPVYQYLQLNVRDLMSDGLNFRAYGRLADDLNDEVDRDSRLYYAYLEKQDLFDKLDVRLGRQFISTTAGATIMDGLFLDYDISDDFALKLFGGGDVRYYAGYDLKDVIDGIELTGEFLDDSLKLGVSYLQRWDEGLLAQDLIGFDAGFDWQGKLWAYNELQWDVLSERLSYSLVGAKYRFEAPFTLRVEHMYSLPVFSSTSIYSVFAVEEYEELMAELTYRLSQKLQLFARLTHEFYDEFSDADVYELGIEKLRSMGFYGYLVGTYRDDDDGQGLYGFKSYVNYQFFTKFRAGLGANIDVLERDIAYFTTDDDDQNETTSTRLWVDGRYDLTERMNLKAKYEYIESDLWDHYNRGTLRLNVTF